MRDPCIIQTPDGKYHMVWTVSWHERGIGYAHSSDLVHWSEQKYIPVMAHEAEAKNCWAPEIFFDDQKNEFLIFWATTIPGRFPETDNQSNDGPPAPGNNHRIYATTTKDFNTFSETRLFFDYGFNVIDATIIMEYGRYFMFIKDETNKPFMTQKNIRLSTSAHANGPWSQPSPSITGKDWVEGPTAIRINNRWHLYFDKYMQGNYGCLVSDDLLTWRDKSAEMVYPKGMRHGSVFKGSKKLLDRLVSLSPAEIPGVTSRVISD
ncbi:MAG: glycosyl hydrolase [Calditrichales bacterium]|nr:MAG: glycosyl hydrolase [Calditrichales bacterium]